MYCSHLKIDIFNAVALVPWWKVSKFYIESIRVVQNKLGLSCFKLIIFWVVLYWIQTIIWTEFCFILVIYKVPILTRNSTGFGTNSIDLADERSYWVLSYRFLKTNSSGHWYASVTWVLVLSFNLNHIWNNFLVAGHWHVSDPLNLILTQMIFIS